MKTLITLLILLSSFVGLAQEQDTTIHTKYAIVSISDYYQLNAQISEAKGYDLIFNC